MAYQEDITKRTKNRKVFFDSVTGKYKEEITLHNQHYQDANGDWQDIDFNNPWREVVAERTARGKVFEDLSRPGVRSADYTIVDQHYQDEQSSWQDINTAWVDSGESGFVDAVTAASFITHSDTNGRRRIYPRRGVTTEYVEFARIQAWNGSSFVNIPWASKTRNGNTITFDRANASLSITHTGGGIKVNVTLKDNSAAARLRWPVSLVGLHRVGWQLLSDADNTVVTTIRQPVITEDGNGLLAEPRPVQCEVVNGAVEFTADLSGLVYPIVIDPTIDVSVGASANDAGEQSDSQNFNYTAAYHNLRSDTTGLRFNNGMRFTGLTGVNGTITTAYMEYYVYFGASDIWGWTIVGHDHDSSPDFATDQDVTTRIANASTTASTTVYEGTPPAVPTWHGSAYEIKSIIQEIIDRPSWDGDTITLFLRGDTDVDMSATMRVRTYDNDPATAAKLHIEYNLTLQPDATDGIDTQIYQSEPTTNYGTATSIIIRGNNPYVTKGLLKFDLSTISGTISSANLYLYQVQQNQGADVDSTIHRILSGNSGWTEGGATWNTIDGSTAWAGAAGCSTANTDYASATMGTWTYDREAVVGTEYTITLDNTEFGSMVSANYGILIKSTYNGDATRCCTSDHATAGYRPKLVVEYTLATGATNMQINIGDAWKTVTTLQINIGDVWKTVTKVQINIGDAWKTIFSFLFMLFIASWKKFLS